jgi:hypothetical protein
MDGQTLRNLQEAYSQVYDEAYKSLPHDKMIAKSNKFDKQYKTGPTNTDAVRRRAKTHLATKFHDPKQSQQKSAANKNRPENEKRSKTVERQKSFGNRLMRSDGQGIRDSYEYDLYDIILSHLLDEGYADTEKAAEAIMVNMSEDWRESIVEEVLDEELSGSRKGKASEILNKKLRDVETLRNLAGRKRTQKTDYGSGNKAARKAGKEVKDSRVVQSDN